MRAGNQIQKLVIGQEPCLWCNALGADEGGPARYVYRMSGDDILSRETGDLAAKAWAKLADLLDLQLSPLGLRAIEALAPQIGESVLDVGCGAGQSALPPPSLLYGTSCLSPGGRKGALNFLSARDAPTIGQDDPFTN